MTLEFSDDRYRDVIDNLVYQNQFIHTILFRYRTGLTVVRCSCPPNFNGSLCEYRRELIPAKGKNKQKAQR